MTPHEHLSVPELVDWCDPVTDDPLNRGLVLWLLAAEGGGYGGNKWLDLCSGKNHGTLTNGPAWQGPLGRPGGWGSLRFDGTDDYVTVAASEPLRHTGAVTFSCWAVARTATADRMPLGRFLTGTGQRVWQLVTSAASATTMQAMVNPNGGPTNTIVSSAAGAVVSGEWAHWAAVYVPSASLTLYKNGVQVGVNTASIPAALYDTDVALTVGARPGGTVPWPGSVDDVQVRSRDLSAAEVRDLHLASRNHYPDQLRRLPLPRRFAPASGGLLLKRRRALA